MIILSDAPGQLCNRIWSTIPCISRCIETNEKLVILFFEYIVLFEHLDTEKNIKFLKINKRWLRLFSFLSRFDFITLGHLKFIVGWGSRHDVAYIVKYQDKIKQIFKFPLNVVTPVNTVFAQNSINIDVRVGVHIRRGDYKNWRNGEYYFEDFVYVKIMEEIKSIFTLEGKNVVFFIASNGMIDERVYLEQGLSTFLIPNSSPSKDLYALSICDYIIGPPSTYSQWASFYGKVPLCFMFNSSFTVKLQDFSPIKSLDSFENGKMLDLK